jgi:Flp pilus assembly protein TadG
MTRYFLRAEDGQTIVVAALGVFVLVSVLGMAIDIGTVRATQRKLQAAAEAGALAAALEIPSCNGINNCAAMVTAAQAALTENGFSVSSVTTNCAAPAGSGLTLTINNPPCALSTGDPNNGNNDYAEVVVSESQPTSFARLVGFTVFHPMARAEAARTGNPNCVYALDRTGGNAITVAALAVVRSSCGIVDESNASNAFSCDILAAIHAPQLKVVGGASNFLCLGMTQPRTGAALPSPADPLAYLPKPAVGACGTTTSSPYSGSPNPLLLVGNAILTPGVYCGGINIGPTANVTFQPGIYTICSGGLLGLQGGLSFDLGANVVGNGVMFYNYGPIGGVTLVLSSVSAGNLTLTAPTTGTYHGVLFDQDPQNTSPAIILGNSSLNTVLQGAYYFPTATVTTAVSGPAQYNILVAKDIIFAVLTAGSTTLNSTTFANNYASLSSGSPLAGSGAVLVQ